MTKLLQPLETSADLDAALTSSATGPVVIFKHSATCGTSAMAYEEVEEVVGRHAAPPVYVVHVQTHRTVSNEVSARFGVRHESPQVLVIRGGRVSWHGSHFHVTSAEIEAALRRAG